MVNIVEHFRDGIDTDMSESTGKVTESSGKVSESTDKVFEIPGKVPERSGKVTTSSYEPLFKRSTSGPPTTAASSRHGEYVREQDNSSSAVMCEASRRLTSGGVHTSCYEPPRKCHTIRHASTSSSDDDTIVEGQSSRRPADQTVGTSTIITLKTAVGKRKEVEDDDQQSRPQCGVGGEKRLWRNE